MRRKILPSIFVCLLSVLLVTNSFGQAPTITSFSPSSGPVGTLVTITGTNLNNPTSFTIGGVSAIVVSNTGTQLVGMVMPGALTGGVLFSNSLGNANSIDNFLISTSHTPNTQDGNKIIGDGSIGQGRQGFSVSLSADGNTALIGAPYDNLEHGAIWVYIKSGNGWVTQGNKITVDVNLGLTRFGESVSISADGNTALIGGRNYVWVFTRNSGIWSQQGNIFTVSDNIGDAFFGVSVAISADGNTAIIGGSHDNGGHGCVWIFSRNNGLWSQQGNKLIGTGGLTNEYQGGAVAISADGNTVIFGGSGDNAAWVFNRLGNIWSQQGNKLFGISDNSGLNQGVSVGLSADGNTAIVGCYNTSNTIPGGAFIFIRVSNIWVQQGNRIFGTNMIGTLSSGSTVSISADGNTVILGDWNDNNQKGAIWFFTRTGIQWTQKGEKQVGTGGIGMGYQGSSVAISADGNYAFVGGSQDNGTFGASWAYKNVSQNQVSSNSSLSSLTLSSGTLSSLLNPAQGFSSPDLSYTTSVSNATNSITLTPTAADPNSTIGIRYTGPMGTFIPVVSGTASAAIPLNVGNIGIEIKVTAQDASTKTYLVVVTRQAAGSVINNFSPSSGPVGTLVTINGTNLNNPTSVSIGGVPAIVISNNGTQLVAMVMPGAVSGTVVINTASGNATGPGTFTVKNTAYPSVQQGNKLVDLNNLNSEQGRAVAISADGNTVLVGCSSTDKSAIVYTRNGNVWSQQGSYLNVNESVAHLGWSVALSGDGNTAVLNSISIDGRTNYAWVFVRNAGIWSQQGSKLVTSGSANRNGNPLAISKDGNTIIFGTPIDFNTPTLAEWSVFVRTGGIWSTQTSLQINNVNASFMYWNAVLSANGNTAVISRPGEGVWVFNRIGNSWTQEGGKIKPDAASGTSDFGTSLAINADGNTIVVGDFACYNGVDKSWGAAFIYNRLNSVWSQKTKLFLDNGFNFFGVQTAISADGKTAIVEGNIYNNNINTAGGNWVFTLKNDIWVNEGLKFNASKPFFNTRGSLSISSDGNTAVEGVYDEDGGGAYIYVADPLIDAGNVSGGNSGGLESKSLGNAVVKRVYTKAQSNLNGPDDYTKMQKVIRRTVNQQVAGFGSISELKLSSMMPDISSRGLIAYNSTPTDIISITNAKEVLSTDFTTNQQCKAVAFATKTQGELYDHTKPICDRLKGASLENVETIKIAGYDFIKYTMHNDKGQLEYATSFSIGTKTGRTDISIQSTWLLKDYVNEENMYNFQLWAATPELVTAMVTDVLNKLQSVAPIKAISSALIPNTYILSGKRESTNLNMVVANTGISSSGYFLVEDKSNEDATITTSRKVPFTIGANGKSSVSIPMNDNYESTITMYVNNAVKDILYMSDGSWYTDYNKTTTSISKFSVTNDSKRIFTADEYPVFRNVTVNAVSKDYVSVVKLMKGGGMEADVSAYKGLKITAAGGHNLHIVLVKNSIVNWKDQYYVDIPLEQDQKEYFVALDKFISNGSQSKLSATDISAIVFSIETSNGISNVINSTLSNISFTKEDLNYLASLELKEIQLFPNPVVGKSFNCNFVSGKVANLTLSITDANGRLIQSQQVNAIKGANSIPVNISINNPGIHFVSLEGANDKYQPKKLVIAKY
jgi:hypothetical protein